MEISSNFLHLFSSPSSAATSSSSIFSGHELHESDVLWHHHSSENSDHHNLGFRRDLKSTSPISRRKLGFRRYENSNSGEISDNSDRKLGFRRENSNENSGILAAISDDSGRNVSSSRPIPKGPAASQAQRGGELTRSAPIKVPPAMMRQRKFNQFDGGFDEVEDDVEDEEMLPPHEMVAMKMKTTSSSSVLEGVGRTLKGRDLRQVRNAVWQQTGFLD